MLVLNRVEGIDICMSIQRVQGVPFAQIANEALRDRRLSFKARGILAMVLSNVGDWEASARWIEGQSDRDGPASIQSGLNELTELGYRKVHRENGPDGRIRTVVEWSHSSITRPMDFPVVGFPDGRKTGGSIEDHLSEDYLSEDHESPESESRAIVRKPVISAPDGGFDRFWAAYPRKESKAKARMAWIKSVKAADPEMIIAGAERYRDDPNREDAFTAHAATWLNGERWEDAPLPSKQKQEAERALTFMEQIADEPCEHGDPRGARLCALCRTAS